MTEVGDCYTPPSMQEIRDAIDKLKANKAEGIDKMKKSTAPEAQRTVKGHLD